MRAHQEKGDVMTEYRVNLEAVTEQARTRRPTRPVEPLATKAVESVTLPQLYTPSEAAAYLRISTSAVRYRLESGELPGRKHCGRWLIRAVDLIAFVEPSNQLSEGSK
jgi:excisionase family DNA binding protein